MPKTRKKNKWWRKKLDIDRGLFFDKIPKARPLYEVFAEKICAEFPLVTNKSPEISDCIFQQI